jgi:mannosyl-oligosaccharide alpha-1,2-mannosidase
MRSGGLQPEIPWIVAMQDWKRLGQRGSPPGVGDKYPWSGVNNDTKALDREMAITGRDYYIRDFKYKLRPEVSKGLAVIFAFF